MQYLGDYAASATVDFMWSTFAADGASITRGTDGSIRIYKNNSVTQRSSSAGITDTEDFDSLTGLHHLRIDLSDNTDAGFYAAGSEYFIVLQGAVIDGETVNCVLAQFSIENRGKAAAKQLYALNTAADLTESSMPDKGLYTAVAKAVHRTRDNAGSLEVYRSDGTTVHATQAITTDAANAPIDELGGAT